MVIVINGLNFERTIAVTRARMIQPDASSTAAAVIVKEPKRVRAMLNSVSIRPKTGSAVIERAVAINSEKPSLLIS